MMFRIGNKLSCGWNQIKLPKILATLRLKRRACRDIEKSRQILERKNVVDDSRDGESSLLQSQRKEGLNSTLKVKWSYTHAKVQIFSVTPLPTKTGMARVKNWELGDKIQPSLHILNSGLTRSISILLLQKYNISSALQLFIVNNYVWYLFPGGSLTHLTPK